MTPAYIAQWNLVVSKYAGLFRDNIVILKHGKLTFLCTAVLRRAVCTGLIYWMRFLADLADCQNKPMLCNNDLAVVVVCVVAIVGIYELIS